MSALDYRETQTRTLHLTLPEHRWFGDNGTQVQPPQPVLTSQNQIYPGLPRAVMRKSLLPDPFPQTLADEINWSLDCIYFHLCLIPIKLHTCMAVSSDHCVVAFKFCCTIIKAILKTVYSSNTKLSLFACSLQISKSSVFPGIRKIATKAMYLTCIQSRKCRSSFCSGGLIPST